MSIERSVFQIHMLSMMEWLATHCKSSIFLNDLRHLAVFVLMLDKFKKKLNLLSQHFAFLIELLGCSKIRKAIACVTY